MRDVASFIKQVVIEKRDPKKIVPKIKLFRRSYQKVHYCFDKKLGAYEYVKLR
jgi:glycine hydroxymethyltransferase